MNGDIRYDRLILSMDDAELEKFCRAWTEKKSGYVEVKRFAGTGDMGRDVVGFVTETIISASSTARASRGRRVY